MTPLGEGEGHDINNLGTAVLGEKLKPLAAEGRAVGVMLPNANGAVVTILGLMSAGRVPAIRDPHDPNLVDDADSPTAASPLEPPQVDDVIHTATR